MFAFCLDGETIAQIGKLIEKLELLQQQTPQLPKGDPYRRNRMGGNESFKQLFSGIPFKESDEEFIYDKTKSPLPNFEERQITPPVPIADSVHSDSVDPI